MENATPDIRPPSPYWGLDFTTLGLQTNFGQILLEGRYRGVPVLIRRAHALCAYLAVPLDHPWAQLEYTECPLNVHGGCTYGSNGDNTNGFTAGYYWLGWDYAHCDDLLWFTDDSSLLRTMTSLAEGYLTYRGHGWTLDEVWEELCQAVDQLLMFDQYKEENYE